MMGHLRFLSLITAFHLLGGVGIAFAEESTLHQMSSQSGAPMAAPKPSPSANWREQTEADCGMMCRYRRANDNLTFQALYLITKLGKIGQAVEEGKTTEARIALGPFCTSSGEDVSACFRRYKDFQRVALHQIRQSIGKNEETIARLTSGRKNDGTIEGDAVFFSREAEFAAYVPEVATVSELEKSYLDGKLKPANGKYSSEDIKKWSIDLVGLSPKGQRYLEFGKTPVDANPFQTEKNRNKVHMVVRDGSGTPQGDRAVHDEIMKSQKSIKEVSEGRTKIGQDMAAISPKELKKEDVVSYEALTEARSILNSRIAGDAKSDDGGRSPAGSSESGDQKTEEKIADGKKADAKIVDGKTSSSAPIDQARDVNVKADATRSPSGYRKYDDEEVVKMPVENRNSRYIRYDLGDLAKEIESSTK